MAEERGESRGPTEEGGDKCGDALIDRSVLNKHGDSMRGTTVTNLEVR
jgi:hypothetical protein